MTKYDNWKTTDEKQEATPFNELVEQFEGDCLQLMEAITNNDYILFIEQNEELNELVKEWIASQENDLWYENLQSTIKDQ